MWRLIEKKAGSSVVPTGSDVAGSSAAGSLGVTGPQFVDPIQMLPNIGWGCVVNLWMVNFCLRRVMRLGEVKLLVIFPLCLEVEIIWNLTFGNLFSLAIKMSDSKLVLVIL
jgi:hypothetical protein